MSKIRPCLWFNNNAEEAMAFYKTVFPDFEELGAWRTPSDSPGHKAGDVVTVEFRLFDQEFVGLNGGTYFQLSEAISFEIKCADQTEVDYYWEKLTADGGEESQCGWLKDKFGLSWQVVPTRFYELITDPDTGRAQRAIDAMFQMQKLIIADLEAAAEAG